MIFFKFNHCHGVILSIFLLILGLSFGARTLISQLSPTPAPRIVEDKNAPQGWSRYEYTYDGGDTLSVIMPKTEHSEFLRGAPPFQSDVISISDLQVKVTERHFTTHLEGVHFIVSYYSGLSVPTDQFNERQRKLFCPMTFSTVFSLDKTFGPGERRWINKIGEPRPIHISDTTGFEQDFVSGPYHSPYHCHVRAVLKGSYAYIIMVAGSGDLKEDQYTPFLNSFRLVKN